MANYLNKDLQFSEHEMPIEIHMVGAYSLIMPPGLYDNIVLSKGIPLYFKANMEEPGTSLIPIASEKQLRYIIHNSLSRGYYPEFFPAENAANDWFRLDDSKVIKDEVDLGDMMGNIIISCIGAALVGISKVLCCLGRCLRRGLENVREQRISIHFNDHSLELRSIIDFILRESLTEASICDTPHNSLSFSTSRDFVTSASPQVPRQLNDEDDYLDSKQKIPEFLGIVDYPLPMPEPPILSPQLRLRV